MEDGDIEVTVRIQMEDHSKHVTSTLVFRNHVSSSGHMIKDVSPKMTACPVTWSHLQVEIELAVMVVLTTGLFTDVEDDEFLIGVVCEQKSKS